MKSHKKSPPFFTCDTPHYPYQLPEGWVWTTLGELFTLQAGKNITAKNISPTQNAEYKYPCFGGNGIRGFVVSSNRNGSYPIIGRQGALCGNVNLANGEFYTTEHAVVVDYYCETDFMWCYYTLEALNLNQYATATAQPGLAVNIINEVYIPLPPYKEQKVISETISYWLSLIDTIVNGKEQLQIAIGQAKSKILDLAIHGKLVPQDPNDEPASELLKRINPKAEIICLKITFQQSFPNGYSIHCWLILVTIDNCPSCFVKQPIYFNPCFFLRCHNHSISDNTLLYMGQKYNKKMRIINFLLNISLF